LKLKPSSRSWLKSFNYFQSHAIIFAIIITNAGEQVDSGALVQVAVELLVGPNIVSSQIKKTRLVELVALLSLAQHSTAKMKWLCIMVCWN